jgi:hypothetical protein
MQRIVRMNSPFKKKPRDYMYTGFAAPGFSAADRLAGAGLDSADRTAARPGLSPGGGAVGRAGDAFKLI